MTLDRQLSRAERAWNQAQAWIADDRKARRSTFRAEQALRDATNEILRIKLKMDQRAA